jgi:hypothetical protein
MNHRAGDPATWTSLSLEKRLADRMLAIRFAADEVREVIAVASRTADIPASAAAFDGTAEQIRNLMRPLLPLLESITSTNVERDAELEDVLVQLDADSAGVRKRASAEERERARCEIEAAAAPYALAFYYEIRRLDSLRVNPLHIDNVRLRDEP